MSYFKRFDFLLRKPEAVLQKRDVELTWPDAAPYRRLVLSITCIPAVKHRNTPLGLFR
jgi:hypothetical protein